MHLCLSQLQRSLDHELQIRLVLLTIIFTTGGATISATLFTTILTQFQRIRGGGVGFRGCITLDNNLFAIKVKEITAKYN